MATICVEREGSVLLVDSLGLAIRHTNERRERERARKRAETKNREEETHRIDVSQILPRLLNPQVLLVLASTNLRNLVNIDIPNKLIVRQKLLQSPAWVDRVEDLRNVLASVLIKDLGTAGLESGQGMGRAEREEERKKRERKVSFSRTGRERKSAHELRRGR
jgi:hypothetical protein